MPNKVEVQTIDNNLYVCEISQSPGKTFKKCYLVEHQPMPHMSDECLAGIIFGTFCIMVILYVNYEMRHIKRGD